MNARIYKLHDVMNIGTATPITELILSQDGTVAADGVNMVAMNIIKHLLWKVHKENEKRDWWNLPPLPELNIDIVRLHVYNDIDFMLNDVRHYKAHIMYSANDDVGDGYDFRRSYYFQYGMKDVPYIEDPNRLFSLPKPDDKFYMKSPLFKPLNPRINAKIYGDFYIHDDELIFLSWRDELKRKYNAD